MRRVIARVLFMLSVVTVLVWAFSQFVEPELPDGVRDPLALFFKALVSVVGVAAGVAQVIDVIGRGHEQREGQAQDDKTPALGEVAKGTPRRWGTIRKVPVPMACWIWPGMCGSGQPAYTGPTSTGRMTGGTTLRRMVCGWCVGVPGWTLSGTPVAPAVAMTTPTAGTRLLGFGWWCPWLSRPLISDTRFIAPDASNAANVTRDGEPVAATRQPWGATPWGWRCYMANCATLPPPTRRQRPAPTRRVFCLSGADPCF